MSERSMNDALCGVIGEKLFEALIDMMAPSIHHAAAINTMGCYLLCHLTGEEYDVVAGSIAVRQGGTPLVLRADPARIDDHEYYVWVERRHADARVELIDFASRYWMDWARELSMPWLGPPPPDILWSYVDELDERTARYTPDSEITNAVRVALHNAFCSPNPPEQVMQWESVINKTLDLLAQDSRSNDYLIRAGLAEPIGPAPN